MNNRYLEAYSYLENGEIKYQNFKLIDNGKITRYTHNGDMKIVTAMEDFNIRPTGSLRNHQAIIKNDKFVEYVDTYLIPKNKKNKKRNKKLKHTKKWWAFVATASVLAILALNTKSKDVTASENETIITTEQETTEEVKPVMNEAPPTIEKEIEITSADTSTEGDIFNNDQIETTMIYNDFEDIFQYFTENLSGTNSDNNRIVEENYGAYLDKYCPMYGMDPVLARAIICQENPSNSRTNPNAHGPAQEEYVHDKEKLSCYNQLTEQYDTITVDLERIDTDMDYAIQVFIMTYMDAANYLYPKFNFNVSDSEFIDIVTDAYNKGKYGVEASIANSNSYDEVINLNKNLGGDYYYRANVYRYLKDGTEIKITTSDGITHTAIFDNTNTDEYLIDSTKEKKAMAL